MQIEESAVRPADVKDIVAAVSDASGIAVSDLMGKGRTAHVALVRQVCYHIARAEGHSLPRIGRGIGGRDHTTVHQDIAAIHARAPRDPDIMRLIANARLQLRTNRACIDRTNRLRSKMLLRIHQAGADEISQMATLLGEEI